MAISRITTWTANQVLTSVALNGEFNNIINNALGLVSPWTANMDAGGFRLITLSAGSVGDPSLQPTGDTNTGIYFSAADTLDITTGGVQAASFGASHLLSAAPQDSRTDSVDVLLELRSTTSGTPAAGIGTGLLFTAESADESPSNVGRLDFALSDVTAGSEDSYLSVLLRIAGAASLTEAFRLSSTGTARMELTHAASAARVMTIPNVANDTFALLAATQSFSNKTYVAPIIGATDWASATHTHAGASTGGAITAVVETAIQTFTTSGTYTKPSDLVFALLVTVGGGGGGGGASASGATAVGGGGGGSGATSLRFLAAASIGATETVTIGAAGAAGASSGGAGGAGGTTSIGTLCVAAGGNGGSGAAAAVHVAGGSGGAQASGTGDIRTTGSAGHNSPPGGTDTSTGGNGGSSVFGGGGIAGLTDANNEANAGADGGFYGAGGGGASSDNPGTAAGGAGSAGIAFVWEFKS